MLTLLILLLLFTAMPLTPSPPPYHFLKSSSLLTPTTLLSRKPREYIEVARSLPSDRLTPSCTVHVIRHSFANTINQPPFSARYSPPSDCPFPWFHVTLEFRAKSKGDQYDRISALWLGGAEILRTSTAEPTENGIFWKVRKDITRYSSLLLQENLNFTIMLENVVNSVYTGVYHVDVTIFFYKHNSVRVPFVANNPIRIPSIWEQEAMAVVKNAYESPADLIIPISSDKGYEKGYWFKIGKETDIHFKKVTFPGNTHKAVLELYVSFHGNDEFWYSNPSNNYIRANNLTSLRGNGAYREVFVTIDGKYVGSEVPFPVVFTGGINPLFWEPVVAIGAFDLPRYDFDLTPFLGMVLDGKDHEIGVGVTDGISYWLLDANLHLWMDYRNSTVAKSFAYYNPSSFLTRSEKFKLLDGSFSIRARRRTKFEGWVLSSAGNLTTRVLQQYSFRNNIRFERNGTFKSVNQKIKSQREVKVFNDVGRVLSHVIVHRRHPLKVITTNLPGAKKDTYVLLTNISHALIERYENGATSSSVHNKQDSNGWMEVKDHSVLSGEAHTIQTLSCRDDSGCYIRTVAANNGSLIKDESTYVCPSVM
uniref:Peptide N-acetyl-beta-D-glucosaminyl asparaginase amidase A N-terminal domain-containing protein n=1 Tax=Rhizophora mucronata TaxID=61149 RepID=A0A2P2Q4H0_RHIMU